jgi:thiol:disulfide interchange protein DsbD
LLLGVALVLGAATLQAAGTPIPHGTLELISENPWISVGHRINLGLWFQLEKGWHIYWINPGDSGEPPRVNWQLPTGITVGEIEWPTPRRLGTSTVVDFGYEGAVTLIVPIRAEANVAMQNRAQVAADVVVLVCREMCVPGKVQLSLTLPIKAQPPIRDIHTEDVFAAARKSLPRPVPRSWRFSVAEANASFVLSANLGHRVTKAALFPLVESQINNATPQEFVSAPGGFRLVLRKSDQLIKPIERLRGVLVMSGERAYLIDLAVGKPVATMHGYAIGNSLIKIIGGGNQK